MLIGKDLELDVPRFLEILLDEDGGIAECRLCDPSPGFQRLPEAFLVMHDVHPYAPAASACLDNDRIAYICRNLCCLPGILNSSGGSRKDRDIGGPHHLLALDF